MNIGWSKSTACRVILQDRLTIEAIVAVQDSVSLETVFVVQDTQVTGITAWGNLVVIQRPFYGTILLLVMQAIIEPAAVAVFKDVRKKMGYFVFIEIDDAEFTDTWRIDDVSSRRKRMHFSKGGGVRPLRMLYGKRSGF